MHMNVVLCLLNSSKSAIIEEKDSCFFLSWRNANMSSVLQAPINQPVEEVLNDKNKCFIYRSLRLIFIPVYLE